MDRTLRRAGRPAGITAIAIPLATALLMAACGSGENAAPPASQLPIAGNGCHYTGLDEVLSTRLSGTDPRGRSLTYSIVEGPTKGSLTLNPLTGEFTYAPNAGARGVDSFRFRVSNSGADSAPATVRVVYTPRIMPLGDSITWGVVTSGQPPLAQRVGFRKPLHDSLLAAGYRLDFVGTLSSGTDGAFLPADPEHEGHGAWTADQLVNGHPNPLPNTGGSRLIEWLDVAAPDVVLLHIGTNDLSPSGDQSDQWPDVENILAVIDDWETKNWPITVVVSRIINVDPESGTPERRAETAAYNANVFEFVITPRLAGGDGLIWVDHETTLTNAADYADLLHPNDDGYRKMANVWLHPLAGAGTATGNHDGPGILPTCS